MTATTWDTNHKTSTTLSGGSLVATSTGTGGVISTRCLQGKTYSEHTITTLTGTPSVGFAASHWNTSTDLKSGVNTLAYLANGTVQINGVTIATIATWAQGNRIDKAHDPANRLVWFRVAGGNWNNDVIANQNPATGVGGIDYSSAMTGLGTLYDAVYASITGNVWTSVFSAGSFAGAAPSGYSSLDATLFTSANLLETYFDLDAASAQYYGPPLKHVGLQTYEASFSPSGPMTYVSGVTEENGVPVASKWVEVIDPRTGDRLGRVKSDGSGNWSIACLGRTEVVAFCLDPTFQALIFDRVIPV